MDILLFDEGQKIESVLIEGVLEPILFWFRKFIGIGWIFKKGRFFGIGFLFY